MGDVQNRNSFGGQLVPKLKTIVFGLVAAVCFILIFLLNRKYPLCLDDWTYSFVYGENPAKRISSMSDIIRSQYNHYFMWGGRSVVHFIAQWLLMQNEWVMDILNSLVYTAYVFLLYKTCNYFNRTNVILFIFINAAVWFFTPVYLFSTTWIVGSANYLWGAAIRLLFIYPYCAYFLSDNKISKKSSYFKSALFFVAGIIAGWTNENTSAAMIFLLFSFLICWKISRRPIPFWSLWGIIGAVIGFVFMVLAPGNYIRTEQVMGVHTIESSFSLSVFIWRLYDLLRANILYYIITYACYLGLIILYTKTKRYNKKILLLSLLFFVSANVALIAMIASPAFPPTVWFGILMYIFIAFGILFANIRFQAIVEKIMIGLVFVLSCTLLVAYKSRYDRVSVFSDQLNSRIDYIRTEKAEGNRNIKIKEHIDVPGVFSIDMDVTPNAGSWQNQCYLEYFDLDSIIYIQE